MCENTVAIYFEDRFINFIFNAICSTSYSVKWSVAGRSQVLLLYGAQSNERDLVIWILVVTKPLIFEV